jgi:hypothetical protein
LKSAMTRHAAAHGIALPQANFGLSSMTARAGRVSGADKLHAWDLLQTIKTNKARCRTIEQYRRAASRDGRIHSLVTFSAATGRTSSSAPTLQNVPRDPRFRSLIKARPGHLILAADYAAIELRIGAALADRAISDIRQRLKQGTGDNWFLEKIVDGINAKQPLRCPPEPDTFNVVWLKYAIPAVAQKVLLRKEQMMASIFSRGLDPHLVTALDMASRQEKLDCGRNPVEWLALKDAQAQNELKAQMHDERQKAKPTNFGLLYGMSAAGLHTNGVDNYGLSWSREEASQARQAWFALYPEFRIWHWWTALIQSRPIPKDKCLVWKSFEGSLSSLERDPKLYEVTALSGRPFKILLDRLKPLNYQDQGTGADILACAIAALPESVADMQLMPVHDELVFEVPVAEAEKVKQIVVDTMIRSANGIIGDRIPVEVEAVLGECWGKV